MRKGWETKTIGDVCEFRGGGTPSKAVARYWRGNIPWVSPKDMRSSIVSDSIDHITSEAIDCSATSLIPKDSVLMVVRSGILARTVPIAISGQDLAINQDLKALCPKRDIDAWFLRYLLDSKMDVLLSMVSRGATVHRLMTEQIRSLDFALPPLSEQRRIVDILDDAFEGIATATANAEQNLRNARALFESHLQAVFTQRGKGWADTRLEEVCGFQNGFAFKSSTFRETGLPILRISNIQDGRVDTQKVVFFDLKDYRESLDHYRIVEGDLLIAMSGATTGKLGFNTVKTVFYLNQRVGKFEPGPKLNKRFLFHFLSTKVEENLRISAGAAQPNLSTEQIKDIVLPIPKRDEQDNVVELLDTIAAETQRLEAIYRQKLAALGELKKSLLHRAFSGAL